MIVVPKALICVFCTFFFSPYIFSPVSCGIYSPFLLKCCWFNCVQSPHKATGWKKQENSVSAPDCQRCNGALSIFSHYLPHIFLWPRLELDLAVSILLWSHQSFKLLRLLSSNRPGLLTFFYPNILVPLIILLNVCLFVPVAMRASTSVYHHNCHKILCCFPRNSSDTNTKNTNTCLWAALTSISPFLSPAATLFKQLVLSTQSHKDMIDIEHLLCSMSRF